jgi:sugar O-acyltransferase (sialic acid O-acetyltransferase NeuD family)
MKILAILGASGHGRVIADAALSSGQWQQVCFYDDAYPTLQMNGNHAVIGDSAALLSCDLPVIVAIGDNRRRLQKLQWLKQHGVIIASVVHHASVISSDARIGVGTVVMAGAVINTGSVIGEGCIINSRAVVEHDCVLADGVHISPGASLGGGCLLSTGVWIGIGASVKQMINFGEFSIAGAGSAVVKPVLAKQVVAGVPARLIKINE